MNKILALQNVASSADPLDDEMCWSTCSSSGCSSSSVFVPVDAAAASCAAAN